MNRAYNTPRDTGSWYHGGPYQQLTDTALSMAQRAQGIFRASSTLGQLHYVTYLFSQDVARLMHNLGWTID